MNIIEINKEDQWFNKLKQRRALIAGIEKANWGVRGRKRITPWVERQESNKPAKPNSNQLNKVYQNVTNDLDLKYPESIRRTYSERRFGKFLSQSTKLEVEKSIWIGNRNIDLFIWGLGGEVIGKLPYADKACGRRFIGLAIEVDGPIHNNYIKMKKDLSKQLYLHDLGVALLTVENEDIYGHQIKVLMDQLASIPRVPSRSKQRLRRRIQLETLAMHANNHVLSELFQCNFNKLLNDWEDGHE